MRERGRICSNGCRQEMRLGTRESDRKSTSCGPNNFHPHQHKGPRELASCLGNSLVCCSCFSFNVGLLLFVCFVRFGSLFVLVCRV
jgi:hypothetical protein